MSEENEPLLPPTFAEKLLTISKAITPKRKPTQVIESNNLPVSAVADQFTDLRMASVFAEMFKDEIRYWPEVGKWLVFDGRRWTTDAPGGAFPYVRRLIEELYQRAHTNSDFAQRAEMLKAILKIEAHPRQETILSSALSAKVINLPLSLLLKPVKQISIKLCDCRQGFGGWFVEI